MIKLVVASNNSHKIAEIKKILSGRFSPIISMAEAGIKVEIEETGATFFDNALIKARECLRLTGCPSLADDSGLSVDALNGRPGVFSARYAGEPCDDRKNNEKLLCELSGVMDRGASFVSVTALCFPNGEYVFGEGRAYGTILEKPSGSGGFGYDPLFYSFDLKKTYAEAGADEKNAVSHRAKSLENLLKNAEKLIKLCEGE